MLRYIFLCKFFHWSISRNGIGLFQKCLDGTGKGCVVRLLAFCMTTPVWLISVLPDLSQGYEEHQMFFTPVTCFEVSLHSFSKPYLPLVFLAFSILSQRPKTCSSAVPLIKIPDVDPFILKEELSLFTVHLVIKWHINTGMSDYVVCAGPRYNSHYFWDTIWGLLSNFYCVWQI